MRDFSIDLIWAKIQAAMPARIRGGKTSFRTQNSSHSKIRHESKKHDEEETACESYFQTRLFPRSVI